MIRVGGIPIKFTKFPGGEYKLEDIEVLPRLHIDFKWENDEEFIHLMYVKRHIDMHGGTAILHMPYIPYARMDRKFQNSIFTLKYLCDFINFLGFDAVYTYDAHSDVLPALINKCNNQTHIPMLVDEVSKLDRIDYIMYPDQGAYKRYKFEDIPSVLGVKRRDPDTGWISEYRLLDTIEEGSNVVIVDDISSYGGTFIHGGNSLKKAGANNIYLAVGHCESSILEGKIFDEDSPITKVFTTNSIIDISNASDRLHISNIY